MSELNTVCSVCNSEIDPLLAKVTNGLCAACLRKRGADTVSVPVPSVSREELDNLVLTSSSDEVIDALFDPAYDKVSFRPHELTEADIIIYTVCTFHGETLNGGIIQYLTNESGDWAHRCGPSLRSIGAEKYATIIEECIREFTNEDSAQNPKWSDDLDEYWDEHPEPFEVIEPRFWNLFRADNDELINMLYEYVLSHRDEFTVNGSP